MTHQTYNALELLLTQCGSPEHHRDGTIYTTEQHVCKNNAGFYIGTYCIEVMNGQWLPQPYSRDSEYFTTEGEAATLLENWRTTDEY